MKKYFVILALCLTSLSTSAGAGTSRDPAQIFYPPNVSKSEPLPVILLLHGYTASGKLMDFYLGLSQRVTSRKFILIVPNGNMDSVGNRYWNATDGCCDFAHSNVDDVSYLKNLVSQTIAKYNGDPKRVFVIGHSNGAFMAHRLACEEGSIFKSIVSFAGQTFLDPANCKNQEPISLLQIHAVDDDTIKYAGDEIGYPMLRPYPDTLTTVDRFVNRNGCTSNSDDNELTNFVASIPGSDTQIRRWNNCANETKVELWTIQPYSAIWHKPHSPLVWPRFTERILDFLLK